MSADESNRRQRIVSPGGLAAVINSNGSLRRLDCDDIVVNLFPGSEIEGGATNLYLRRLEPEISWIPLLGPVSPLHVEVAETGLRAAGEWDGVRISLALVLSESTPAWFWHVALENRAAESAALDLVYAQDVALTPYGAARMNEFYASQYLDHTPLAHPKRGWTVAVRQNLAVGTRFPWALIGSLGHAAGFATDALQLYGLAARSGRAPAGLEARALPSIRRQHEHALVALAESSFVLAPGETARRGFYGWIERDHPQASGPADLALADRALALPEAAPREGNSGESIAASAPVPAKSRSLFASRPVLECIDLDDAALERRFGPRSQWRHVERENGVLLSFFTEDGRHVVLRAKEKLVLRPHGHLLRTGAALVPEEASLTTTVWMGGVFGSLLTQGHVGINRLVSSSRSYLGLFRAHGQRCFVEQADGFHLLGTPSAFEMTPSSARWVYAHAGGTIEVRTGARFDRHAIELSVEFLEGDPTRILFTSHVAVNGDDGAEPIPTSYTADAGGVTVHVVNPDSDLGRRFPQGSFRIESVAGAKLERVGGDEVLFGDGHSRGEPFLALQIAPARKIELRATAALVPDPTPEPKGRGDALASASFWSAMAGARSLSPRTDGAFAGDVGRIGDILPWYAHDALIHYLAPRGLEQFSGGGWGTRDVCQGPVECLLALGRFEPIRDLLLRVFANQNPNGDWPQWFMFFERERNIRPDDSHGDIVFWPLLALARYLLAADDASILDASVPFFDGAGPDAGERATIAAHVDRALALITQRVIPGTHLAAYGHGDWDDSLQPADPAMRERLCSAWTVTLHHETLATLARALRHAGRALQAADLEGVAGAIHADFIRHLLVDGEITGFAYFQPDGRLDYLMHPRDTQTGITHRLLPMVHAVLADLLTPEQAHAQIEIIRAHLLGADGARLCDRPATYRGGPTSHFQRAESSSFFGREMGLLYTHAHLRFAEALAHLGDADAFFDAIRRATPIALRTVLPAAALRQASCYFSSSDAAVADRYEGAARYDDVRAGRVPLEGGWRVYSSGAGIAVRLIHQSFLGVRRGRTTLGIDPVVPPSLDGMTAEVDIDGRPVAVTYRVAARGSGPTAVSLNGRALTAERMSNPYRTPGVTVSMAEVRGALRKAGNELSIELE